MKLSKYSLDRFQHGYAKMHWIFVMVFAMLVVSGLVFIIMRKPVEVSINTGAAKNQSQPAEKSNMPQATKDLLNKVNELRLASQDKKAAIVDQLKTQAQVRHDALLSLIISDPSEVLRNTIPQKLKAQMPAEVQSLIESEVTLTGTYTWLHGHDEENKTSKNLFSITDSTNHTYNLHFSIQQPGVLTGTKASIKGVKLDSEIALTSDKGNFIAGKSNVLGITTPIQRKVGVIMVNFQDDIVRPYTPDYLRSAVFTDPVLVNGYYQDVSFNKLGLTGALSPDGDVFGWYTLPYNIAECNLDLITNQAKAAAAANGFINSNYDHFMVVLGSSSGCGWMGGAWGTVGGTPAGSWFFDGNIMISPNQLAHELGHNLGLDHAAALVCHQDSITGPLVAVSNYCVTNEYADGLDIMGQVGGGSIVKGHLNNYHKGQAFENWLAPANILTLDRATNPDGTYTIAPIETSSAGVQVIRIPRDYYYTRTRGCGSACGVYESHKGFYYLEFRQPDPFERFDSTFSAANGITIRLATDYSTVLQSQLIDTLPDESYGSNFNNTDDAALTVGKTFNDPNYNINISTLSVSPTGAQVRITFGPVPCVNAPPTFSISAISPSFGRGVAGETVGYTYSLTNKDSSVCAPSTFSIISSDIPAGLTLSPSTFLNETLAPGASVTRSFGATSPITAAIGSYFSFSLKASNIVSPALNFSNSSSGLGIKDGAGPIVSISQPISGSTVSAITAVNVSATDVSGVKWVQLLANNSLVGTITGAGPYSFSWNSASSSNGPVNLVASAMDAWDNLSTSSAVPVNVSNTPPSDLVPPITSITSPAPGSTVSGTANVSASASDNVGVTKVEFYINNNLEATFFQSPFTFAWDSKTAANGSATIFSKAFDAAGNIGTSPAVTFNVSNTTTPPPPPSGSAHINLSPVSLSFTATSGGATPAAKSSTLSNSGTTSLIWTASTNQNWCHITPASGTTAAGGNTSLSVFVDSPSNVGAFSCNISISGNADNSPQSITVSYTVTATNPSDTIAPTTSITSPLNGGIVTKRTTITITANASDDKAVTKVEFYVNGSLVIINKKTNCTDTVAPYTCSWAVPNSPGKIYTLTAKAYDASGNVGTSPAVSVTSK